MGLRSHGWDGSVPVVTRTSVFDVAGREQAKRQVADAKAKAANDIVAAFLWVMQDERGRAAVRWFLYADDQGRDSLAPAREVFSTNAMSMSSADGKLAPARKLWKLLGDKRLRVLRNVMEEEDHDEHGHNSN